MKQCKTCRKEIDESAARCPYCHSFQHWKNPYTYALIAAALMAVTIAIVSMMWQAHLYERAGLAREQNQFLDYRNGFVVDKVNHATSDNQKEYLLTYKIANKTPYRWENVQYEIIGKNDKGVAIFVCTGVAYPWIVWPDSSSLVTATCRRDRQIKEWQFRITNMNSWK